MSARLSGRRPPRWSAALMHPLANLAAFNAGWFAAVLGAAHGMTWLGPAYYALWLPAHTVAARPHEWVELRVLLAAAPLGYTFDSLLVLSGFIAFPAYAQLGSPSTLWMVTMWMGFAATLRHCLGWLRGRPLLAAALAAVGGPLAYWGGERFGALTLTTTYLSLTAIGIAWVTAMLVLLGIVRRAERRTRPRSNRAREFVPARRALDEE